MRGGRRDEVRETENWNRIKGSRKGKGFGGEKESEEERGRGGEGEGED